MQEKVLDTGSVYFEIIDGILKISYKPDLRITYEVAKKIVKHRLTFTKGKSYPGLLEDKGITEFTREAREFFASEEGIKGVTAAALVVNSGFSSFLGNFFMSVTVIKPRVPTRLFTNRDKALKWLAKYKNT